MIIAYIVKHGAVEDGIEQNRQKFEKSLLSKHKTRRPAKLHYNGTVLQNTAFTFGKSLILAIIILPESKNLPLCDMVREWRTGGRQCDTITMQDLE